MSISIWFKYPGNPPEVVDTAETQKDAEYLLKEYRMAYGPGSVLWAGARNQRSVVKKDVVSSRPCSSK